MKNRLMTVITAIIILLTLLCGFTTKQKGSQTPRFTESHITTNITVITDNETGVQYLSYRTSYGTGLTRLEEESFAD